MALQAGAIVQVYPEGVLVPYARQMREFQERAIQDLMLAQSSLDAGLSGAAMGAVSSDTRSPDAAVASTPDEAPAEYREMVSDYFKAIGELK